MTYRNYLLDENPDALVYQPIYCHRVIWRGGYSKMLQFEIITGTGWKEIDVKSFNNFPTGVKELLSACQEFYQNCLEEHELNKA